MRLICRPWLLAALTVVAVTGVFFLSPIAQSQSFHNFADKRTLWGIKNVANVISNFLFLIVGVRGLLFVGRSSAPRGLRFLYTVLFSGVALTGLGSAWYHSDPNNDTLVWDRIPMTIVFMALLSATVAELISLRLGTQLLIPLVSIGIGSVWLWHYTEGQGFGDLRLYYLIQYYPIFFIPLILWLYYDPSHRYVFRQLAGVVCWYIIAKILEQLDLPIYVAVGISGHTLKHLAAGVSTWWLVVLFRERR
jgi:hypothetical protein